MLKTLNLFFDSAVNYQTGFQDPASPIMESIIDLHHDIMGALIFIGVWVFWMLLKIVVIFRVKKDENNNTIRDGDCPLGVTLLRIRNPIDFTHDTKTEFTWTVLPTILLILVSGPSLSLLYAVEESAHAAICIKCIGHQWYWSYSYKLGLNIVPGTIAFDSYMINEADLEIGQLRLLEVDNRLLVPTNVQIRLHITSDDVLHSWCVPSLGVKIDACPGRLTAIDFFVRRSGVFYGQCSEICGVNHAFMPIVVQSIDLEQFMDWVFFYTTEGRFPTISDFPESSIEKKRPYSDIVLTQEDIKREARIELPEIRAEVLAVAHDQLVAEGKIRG